MRGGQKLELILYAKPGMVELIVADLLTTWAVKWWIWSQEDTPPRAMFQTSFVAPPYAWELLLSNMLDGTHPVVLLKFLSYSFTSRNNEPERRANNPHLSPWSRSALMIFCLRLYAVTFHKQLVPCHPQNSITPICTFHSNIITLHPGSPLRPLHPRRR